MPDVIQIASAVFVVLACGIIAAPSKAELQATDFLKECHEQERD
jgi:hypothetical protein